MKPHHCVQSIMGAMDKRQGFSAMGKTVSGTVTGEDCGNMGLFSQKAGNPREGSQTTGKTRPKASNISKENRTPLYAKFAGTP